MISSKSMKKIVITAEVIASFNFLRSYAILSLDFQIIYSHIFTKLEFKTQISFNNK